MKSEEKWSAKPVTVCMSQDELSDTASASCDETPVAQQDVLDMSPRLKTKGKRTRPPRFSKEVREYLDNWLSEHIYRPWPTIEQKRKMAAHTGLTVSQVSTYLVNHRRRSLGYTKQFNPRNSDCYYFLMLSQIEQLKIQALDDLAEELRNRITAQRTYNVKKTQAEDSDTDGSK